MRQNAIFSFALAAGLFVAGAFSFSRNEEGKTKEKMAAQEAAQIIEEFGNPVEGTIDEEQFREYLKHKGLHQYDKNKPKKLKETEIDEEEYYTAKLYVKKGDKSLNDINQISILERFYNDSKQTGSIKPDSLYSQNNYWKVVINKKHAQAWQKVSLGKKKAFKSDLANWILEERTKKIDDAIINTLKLAQDELDRSSPISPDELMALFLTTQLEQADIDRSGLVDFFEYHRYIKTPEKELFLANDPLSEFALVAENHFIKTGLSIESLKGPYAPQHMRRLFLDKYNDSFPEEISADTIKNRLDARIKNNELLKKSAVTKKRGFIPGRGYVLTPTRVKRDKKLALKHELIKPFDPQTGPDSVILRVIKDYQISGAKAEPATFNVIKEAGANSINEWDGALKLDLLRPRWLQNDWEAKISTGVDLQRSDNNKERKRDSKFYFSSDLWFNFKSNLIGSTGIALAPYYQENTQWVPENVTDENGNEILGEDGEPLQETVRKYTQLLAGVLELTPTWGPLDSDFASDMWQGGDFVSVLWSTRFAYVHHDVQDQPVPKKPEDKIQDQGFIRTKLLLGFRLWKGWSRLDYNFTHWDSQKNQIGDARFHDLSLKFILMGDVRLGKEDERLSLVLSYKRGIENPIVERKEVEQSTFGMGFKF